jgi:hypothetical protein
VSRREQVVKEKEKRSQLLFVNLSQDLQTGLDFSSGVVGLNDGADNSNPSSLGRNLVSVGNGTDVNVCKEKSVSEKKKKERPKMKWKKKKKKRERDACEPFFLLSSRWDRIIWQDSASLVWGMG